MLNNKFGRFLSLVSIALFLAGGFLFFVPSSALAATTCSQTGCDHKDPTQTQNTKGQLCSAGAYTVPGGSKYFTGATLELRWGPNCQTN